MKTTCAAVRVAQFPARLLAEPESAPRHCSAARSPLVAATPQVLLYWSPSFSVPELRSYLRSNCSRKGQRKVGKQDGSEEMLFARSNFHDSEAVGEVVKPRDVPELSTSQCLRGNDMAARGGVLFVVVEGRTAFSL